MSDRIRELLAEITRLEDELEQAVHEQQTQVLFRIEGTRVRFERRVHAAHAKLKVGMVRWLMASNLRNIASSPLSYSLVVPLAILDAWLWVYQSICFPLYRLPKVRRDAYIVIDRHHLAYLNSVEKLNCAYCGYANGLIAYAREIASRTEQYWCPIKHACRVLGAHRRQAGFLDFGDSHDYHARLHEYRRALREEES